MLAVERFNADKLVDSLLLEIGSSKLKEKMERKIKLTHQTIRSSPLVLLNSQNALV
jgi:hypothetical protein